MNSKRKEEKKKLIYILFLFSSFSFHHSKFIYYLENEFTHLRRIGRKNWKKEKIGDWKEDIQALRYQQKLLISNFYFYFILFYFILFISFDFLLFDKFNHA